MSAKDVEKRAVHAVSEKIMQTSKMDDYFSENDKTPATDGKIIVYSDASKENKYLLGEINVQIKGESVKTKEFKEEKINYSLKVDHLRYYRSIGGAIIFVDKQTSDKKSHIYYNMLLPLDLEDILCKLERPDQKSKSIEFLKLPEDIKELEYIFELFVDNSKKQQSTAKQGYINSEELKELEGNKRFAVFKPHLKLIDGKLPNIPSYIYGYNKDLDIYIPLTKVLIEAICAEVNSDLAVSLNEEQFYDRVRVINTNSIEKPLEIDLRFGQSIVFKLLDEGDKIGFKVEYVICGTVEERIKDLKFLLGLLDGKTLVLGNKVLDKIRVSDNESDKQTFINEWRALLNQHNELKKCLDVLHVKKEIDLDNITEKDSEQLNMLVQAINYGHEVNLRKTADKKLRKEMVISLNISNLKILVAIEKAKDGKYKFKSFYDEEFGMLSWKLGPSEIDSIECSRFIAVSRWDIENVDNVDCEILVDDFKKFKPIGAYEDALCNKILSLLIVYDNRREMQFLDSATKLAEWLNIENPSIVHRLNYLQCIKRSRVLCEKEIAELCKMEENINNDINISGNEKYKLLIAVNILLDSYSKSVYYLNKLSGEEKGLFEKYPMYNLLKNPI